MKSRQKKTFSNKFNDEKTQTTFSNWRNETEDIERIDDK